MLGYVHTTNDQSSSRCAFGTDEVICILAENYSRSNRERAKESDLLFATCQMPQGAGTARRR
jgi:hypothetical protein